MKCGGCRLPTEWLLTRDRKIKCKNCKRNAPPSLKGWRCKHRFMDKSGNFSKFCYRKCGIILDLSEDQMKEMRAAEQIRAKKETENKAKEEVKKFEDLKLEDLNPDNMNITF